jgi:hypothetical protein
VVRGDEITMTPPLRLLPLDKVQAIINTCYDSGFVDGVAFSVVVLLVVVAVYLLFRRVNVGMAPANGSPREIRDGTSVSREGSSMSSKPLRRGGSASEL